MVSEVLDARGATTWVGQALVNKGGSAIPRLLLLTMLLAAGLTALIGLIGTVATVLMSLCVGAAVAFLTPVATPANMMVMGPAGYRFGDYWRLGLPLVALFAVIGIFWVPVVWHF